MATSRWVKHLLTIVGVYYLLSGLFNAIFPKLAFKVAEMDVPTHLFVWQHISIMFAVLGFGFLIAATNPTRYWPIVFMGLLKMVFGISGFLMFLSNGCVTPAFGIQVLLSDGIWIVPIIMVLRWTFKENNAVEESLNYLSFSDDEVDLKNVKDQNGEPILKEDGKPILLVFLRHFGCAYCKDTLRTLQREKTMIEKLGARLVIVHMSDNNEADTYLKKYGLENVSSVSDPECNLYRKLDLEKAELEQLINVKGFFRSVDLFLFKGLMHRKTMGDPAQMPGVFLIKDGVILNSFRHKTASDVPDYVRLAHFEEM